MRLQVYEVILLFHIPLLQECFLRLGLILDSTWNPQVAIQRVLSDQFAMPEIASWLELIVILWITFCVTSSGRFLFTCLGLNSSWQGFDVSVHLLDYRLYCSCRFGLVFSRFCLSSDLQFPISKWNAPATPLTFCFHAGRALQSLLSATENWLVPTWSTFLVLGLLLSLWNSSSVSSVYHQAWLEGSYTWITTYRT
jgi:hypothetical protein